MKSVRMHSLSIDWSDSDSSIDSMPDSGGEWSDNEDGWPEHTGYQVWCGQGQACGCGSRLNG